MISIRILIRIQNLSPGNVGRYPKNFRIIFRVGFKNKIIVISLLTNDIFLKI